MADMPKDETSFPTPTSSASKSPTPTNIMTNSPMVTVTTVLTAEEQAYDQFMIEHHTQFNQYMSNLGALFQVEEDEFVYSDDWHLSVERNLELMISEAEVIASYENVPEKFTDVHHWLAKLEPESRKFSEFVLRAIEDENINILELNQFFTSLYDILAYVVNANMEREKIISSVPDSWFFGFVNEICEKNDNGGGYFFRNNPAWVPSSLITIPNTEIQL